MRFQITLPLNNFQKQTLRLFILTILLVVNNASYSQNIKIGLYRNFELRTLIFKVQEGSYTITNQDSLNVEMNASDVLFVTALGQKLSLWNSAQHLGIHESIKITTKNSQNKMSIEPAYPVLPTQKYYGNFEITIDTANRMTATNTVPLKEYLAGVIEAESGTRALPEYYKAQAIICRTYVLNHLDRHKQENFQICDEVHCQVYKGFGIEHGPILKAVEETKGQAIIDNQGMLITAAFHANSGGETANSEDVWSTTMSYLRGKSDPYFEKHRHSHWTVTISLDEWTEFLQKMNLDTTNKTKIKFIQKKRTKFYLLNDQPILLSDIRSHFKLKSTLFSIEKSENKIIFNGRGYGHGVGLSQESAMEMARRGKSYQEIINFFYTDIKIIDIYQTTYLQALFPEEEPQ
ncbi:MAG: SpoIID/LytB domain-containing protein [Salinivirgaceae bacterium]|nr:SpoIID/LytB domain-containing protein [Salinivirgaceae bacterium]